VQFSATQADSCPAERSRDTGIGQARLAGAGNQPVADSSGGGGCSANQQTALLRNMGSAALSISSITVNGDFAETDDCGSSVAAAASCTISITFSPTAQGAFSGSVVIADDAAGAPHTITLYGVGEGGSSANPAPDAVLMPSALTFQNVPVGRPGAPQNVTLANAGNASLTIDSIQASGDFSQTNSCPGSLGAGAQCTISIVFTPSAEGTRSGSLTIADNAQGTPQALSLTGTGTAGSLVVTSNSVLFSSVQVGASASQLLTLNNTGNGPVSINGLQITGDYSEINNCPSPINGGTSCTITVVFTPTVAGVRSGTFTITSGAATQQNVLLSGTGLAPDLVVTPTAVTFSSTPLGASSVAEVTKLTNTGNASLTISNMQLTGDYRQTNDCPATLIAGASCTMNVVFVPSTTGSQSGNLVIATAAGVLQTIALSGTGVDFNLSASSSGNSVQPGSSATYTLTASAVGGSFPDALSLSCSGLPSGATCSFSPSAITPGASQATTTLTIGTAESVSENMPFPQRHAPVGALWAQLQGLGVVGLVLANGKRRSRKTVMLVLLLLMVLGLLLLSGCAGGTGIAPQNQNNPHTYTVTVTGKYGSLQHTIPVSLTIE
jgi:hypothetical protein